MSISLANVHGRVALHNSALLCFVIIKIKKIMRCRVRGFAKLKKFKKSQNNLEVGGWVQVPFG